MSKAISDKKKRNFEEVKYEFESRELILLTKENEYKNEQQKLTFICKHHPKVIQHSTLATIKNSKYGCRLCATEANSDKMRGSLSPLYKGTRTNAKIIRDSLQYKRWRQSVFKRDNFTCQCCGAFGGKLNVHHIKSFSDYPDLRFDVDNGITMCEQCHSSYIKGGFHNLYGTHNNTTEQLEEYIKLRKNSA